MEVKDIISIIAIIISPIVAVLVGQILQNREKKRADKMEVFKTLMVFRGLGWTPEKVNMNYNANMRSLVVDKLNNTEMVVFNRFSDNYDPNEFHKIVRGVTRRAEIVYEYTDGRVAYDDIEDPLPFDVDADEITIEDKDFALWYRDIMEEPMKYDGKLMTFKALTAKNSKFPENTYAVGRHIMTCCVEDIQYCWMVAQDESGNEPPNKEWITITGKVSVQKHKLYKAINNASNRK